MNYSYQSLQAGCTEQQQQIIDAIQNKTIDSKLVVNLPNITVYIGDGWYEVSILEVYILAYVNKSDPNYDYKILIIKTPGVIINCGDITISKTNKDGTSAPDNVLPQNVIDNAITTFPASATACGTGLWEGCTVGIQNKYLIIGGGILGLYFMSKG